MSALTNMTETSLTNCLSAVPPAISHVAHVADEATGNEIRALNGLIVTVLDNADEYRRAIFALEQRLDKLQSGVYNRVQAVEQLQSRVRALGGQPATSRSTLATAFAALLAVRNPFAKDHEKDLLQDVERGEQTLRRQFRICLADEQFSDATRLCIGEALTRAVSDRSKPGDSWNPQCTLVGSNSMSSPLPSS